MDNPSGVGVIDKAAMVLDTLEAGPTSLAQLVAATGLARPTAHRLALALVHHRLVSRDMQGRFVLGSRLVELAAAAGEDRLIAAAGPVLMNLRDATGESAQVFRRQGDARVCVASAERPIGLRDTIPVGTQLSMKAGSAAQVLLAWEDHERLLEGLHGRAFHPDGPRRRAPSRLGPKPRRTRARSGVGLGAGPRTIGARHRRCFHFRPDRAAHPAARPAACRGGLQRCRTTHRSSAKDQRLAAVQPPKWSQPMA